MGAIAAFRLDGKPYGLIGTGNPMMPTVAYSEAIRMTLQQCMQEDPDLLVMGLGVPDPGGVFGTTKGLQELFGEERVFDIPCSENGITGVGIGLALGGKKVVLSHQRVDFALLAMEQLINQAGKWHFMFGGQDRIALVIRMIVGRGWGQGPQHSQMLASLFAHIPGLQVLAPVFPKDAGELLEFAIRSQRPTVYLEHRWLHFVQGVAPEFKRHLDQPSSCLVREGSHFTLVSYSYGVLECLEAAKWLSSHGIETEVIDLRSLRPFDPELILASVEKTGRLLVFEMDWANCGVASEVIAQVAMNALPLHCAPIRIALPEYPLPAAPSLAKEYYPDWKTIVRSVTSRMEMKSIHLPEEDPMIEHDKPNPQFKGPF